MKICGFFRLFNLLFEAFAEVAFGIDFPGWTSLGWIVGDCLAPRRSAPVGSAGLYRLATLRLIAALADDGVPYLFSAYPSESWKLSYGPIYEKRTEDSH